MDALCGNMNLKEGEHKMDFDLHSILSESNSVIERVFSDTSFSIIKVEKIKRGFFMSRIYFTIAGTQYYHGKDFFKPNMQVKLVKEPDNPVDREAIKVEVGGLGLVGYVANSPYTVLGESMSAGRIYDKIGDKARGTVLYVVDKGVICFLNKEERYGRNKKRHIGLEEDLPF